MEELAYFDEYEYEPDDEIRPTYIARTGPGSVSFRTFSKTRFTNDNRLSETFRETIARCAAVSPRQRIRLRKLLSVCQAKVNQVTARQRQELWYEASDLFDIPPLVHDDEKDLDYVP